ncbi:MAG: DNA polymerase III subunit gamma/tau C-terminal domain-containing protein, partial [Litorivicinaceae bacterium]
RAGEYISEAESSRSMPDAESNTDPEPVPKISAVADTEDVEALIPSNTTDNAVESGSIRVPDITFEPIPKQHVTETVGSVVSEARAVAEVSAPEVKPLESDPSFELSPQVMADSVRSGEGHETDEVEDDVNTHCLGLTFAPEAWIFESQLLDLHGMTASLVAQTILVSATPDEVILATNSHTEDLLNDMHRRRVAEAFELQLGRLPKIVVETRDELAETPEEYRRRLKEERLAHAKHQFAEDPFVSELKERFDATVREESIEPRDGGTHV